MRKGSFKQGSRAQAAAGRSYRKAVHAATQRPQAVPQPVTIAPGGRMAFTLSLTPAEARHVLECLALSVENNSGNHETTPDGRTWEAFTSQVLYAYASASGLDPENPFEEFTPTQCYACDRLATSAEDAATFVVRTVEESDPETGPMASDLTDVMVCPACDESKALHDTRRRG